MTTEQPGASPALSDQLGPDAERAKWYARGQDWALASALSDPGAEWMSDDIANAYADGAMAAIVAERERAAKRHHLRFAGWFCELPSGMSYRLWEQGGHAQEPGYVALYELA